MEVVKKNSVALSLADGITSVYEAKSIASPRSKLPPIRHGRPVKYNAQIGSNGYNKSAPISRCSHEELNLSLHILTATANLIRRH